MESDAYWRQVIQHVEQIEAQLQPPLANGWYDPTPHDAIIEEFLDRIPQEVLEGLWYEVYEYPEQHEDQQNSNWVSETSQLTDDIANLNIQQDSEILEEQEAAHLGSEITFYRSITTISTTPEVNISAHAISELEMEEEFITLNGSMEGWGGICKWKKSKFDSRSTERVCAYASGKFPSIKAAIDAEIYACTLGNASRGFSKVVTCRSTRKDLERVKDWYQNSRTADLEYLNLAIEYHILLNTIKESHFELAKSLEESVKIQQRLQKAVLELQKEFLVYKPLIAKDVKELMIEIAKQRRLIEEQAISLLEKLQQQDKYKSNLAIGFIFAKEAGVKDINRQNNTIIELLLSINTKLDLILKKPVDTNNQVADLAKQLEGLNLGRTKTKKPEPFFVYKDPLKTLKEEREKLRKEELKTSLSEANGEQHKT
ncbi:hypothetical protein ZIOFF_020905 [Zingiber officinale]|uniref:Uncharacterized protein n=1 Tax=Zingiber officinale TaxID=94328 RepID=A0A8J5H0R9_ZINOF|nr:hypothetical protein ZIOFF_020905 [Zingiber officinale]